MSSHHIIRDNQEPAVFIADIQDGLSENLLAQILEWSPTIISLASSIELLESKGIKVNVLLQSLHHPILDDIQADMEVRTYPEDNYLPALFDYLRQARNFAVYLFGCPLETGILSYADRFTISLIQGNRNSLLINRYSKWLPQGTKIYLEAGLLTGTFDNLIQSGENAYQVVRDGFVNIPQQKGYFFLTEEL